MSFRKSDQKSMLMVGFLTCNDSYILRSKTGPYRRVGYQTNIPPTMCPSNHVSHCLEEFSPQTSPSGISYPMVGVPSMCPPPPINLWQYSTLHPHPCTHAPTPSPAALPHWDMPVHPCFPLPGGIFTTNQP